MKVTPLHTKLSVDNISNKTCILDGVGDLGDETDVSEADLVAHAEAALACLGQQILTVKIKQLDRSK